MRTKIVLLSLSFVLLFTTFNMAQSSSGGSNPAIGLTPSSVLLKENQSNALGRKNVVKIGLVSLFGLDPHVAYERVLNDRHSINVTFAFIGLKRIPSVEINSAPVDANIENKFSIFSVTPEYRFYLSQKDMPAGFYIGPYLRYSRYAYKIGTVVELDDPSGTPEDVVVDIDGAMTSVGLGIQMGVQWVIKDRVVIDWSFLGFSMNRYQIKTTARVEVNNVDFEELAMDIEEVLDVIPFLGKRFDFEANAGVLETKVPFFGPGFRTNLKVGILF